MQTQACLSYEQFITAWRCTALTPVTVYNGSYVEHSYGLCVSHSCSMRSLSRAAWLKDARIRLVRMRMTPCVDEVYRHTKGSQLRQISSAATHVAAAGI